MLELVAGTELLHLHKEGETMANPTEEITRPTARTQATKGRRNVEKLTSRLETLQVKYIPIDNIHPNHYNANRQEAREFDLLIKSMEEDGFTQPIIVQSRTNEIVDGEHRWRAAHQLGYKEIPVVFVDMTPEQMRISTLRHNRARGSEDVELSTQVLRDLRELGALEWAMDSLDLNTKQLDALLSDAPAPDLLARDEFNTAWEPANNPDHPVLTLDTRLLAVSDESRQLQYEQANQTNQTQSPEERTSIRQQKATQTRTLLAIIDVADYPLIESVLGANPAQRLLELCKLELSEQS